MNPAALDRPHTTRLASANRRRARACDDEREPRPAARFLARPVPVPDRERALGRRTEEQLDDVPTVAESRGSVPGAQEDLPFATLAPAVASAAGHAPDILPVLIDQLADLSRVQARARSDIGDRSAEPNIVAQNLHTVWILEDVFDVSLTNAEASVDIPTIVGLVSFSHLPSAPCN